MSQQIQQAADKIWPSLDSYEQEELSAQQQQHTQLLKNTLNTAKSQRSRLEQGAEMWRDYTQSLERVRAVISRTRFTDEPVTTLAGLQFNIQKITHALNDIQVRWRKQQRYARSIFLLLFLQIVVTFFSLLRYITIINYQSLSFADKCLY